LKPNSIRVVFVTTVFEGVDTGPGIFAHYLWRAFRDDPDVEFHVVAPEIAEIHPRLHSTGNGDGSLDLYRRVQDRAMEVAIAAPGTTILHGNSTHCMGRLIDYPGPLVTQVNDYETATFPSSAARIAYELGLRKMLSTAWRYREERRVLRRADMALCNSTYTASVIGRRYGLPGSALRVVHKAVDTTAFRRPETLPADPAPERPRGSRLVFVGAEWQRKGLDTLLQAIASLTDVAPDVSLAVIGPDRDDASLASLIRSLDLLDRVTVVGKASRELLKSHLWHADAFVLPSRREALGVAVLEAMAAGLPVVATAVGGIPEMVRSGVEGVLVRPARAQELSAALEQLLLNPARRALMSQAGLVRAQQFSVDTMVAALRLAYIAAAESRSSAGQKAGTALKQG
jgi:glycosyltransferase involved in cell wall biosynthesis